MNRDVARLCGSPMIGEGVESIDRKAGWEGRAAGRVQSRGEGGAEMCRLM